ncbi:thymidine kinase [Membranihabitans maritimus]|uniref:thymidine kinase n=1 Tax=Membranihabitans maritimus TaxID=2904244 RepID=UPI001F00764F|nr:thymidine kinase [Membranihabitans maritimus]
MFLEPHYRQQRSGWIEVVCGCMFSGKTEELLRRLKRAEIAQQNVVVFKPSFDKRYSMSEVKSHDDSSRRSIMVESSEELVNECNKYEVFGVDEAQFFDDGIVDVVQELALRGKRVIIAGLDMDYRGEPFGPMPHLLAIAEYVTKLHAICQRCGSLATHSYRIDPSDSKILLGAKGEYEPRCRHCFDMGNILDFNPENAKHSPPDGLR